MLKENIKRYRRIKGYNQQELADAMGVSLQTVSNWEIGRFIPNVKNLHQIAAELDCTVADLYKEVK